MSILFVGAPAVDPDNRVAHMAGPMLIAISVLRAVRVGKPAATEGVDQVGSCSEEAIEGISRAITWFQSFHEHVFFI